MRLFIKFIFAPILLFLTGFVFLQTYSKYKIKYLLRKWEKKYHPFPSKKEAQNFQASFFDITICLYIIENILIFYFLTLS